MVSSPRQGEYRLGLRAGELVEVKSLDEIVRTLDSEGKCAGLPFMPEMVAHCGKQYRVFRRADKTCDSINGTWMLRRMYDTVLLEMIRCGGEAHGGCEAGCMVFWKEAWLKRVNKPALIANHENGSAGDEPEAQLLSVGRIESRLGVIKENVIKRQATEDPKNDEGERYCCQATELHKCTDPLSPSDLRQYARDIVTRNVGIVEFLKGIAVALFNLVQKRRKACTYPYVQGSLSKTPRLVTNLQVGEMVRVKSLDEIVETLDVRNRNRGLLFDLEMASFCGGTFKVARRVEKIINESTGKMLKLPNDCIVLEGVSCKSQVHGDRLFCPRRIYSYWREAWLERV